jgi:hypothetical protein
MFLRIARLIPAKRIVFAVLVVVGSLITQGQPGYHASDAE